MARTTKAQKQNIASASESGAAMDTEGVAPEDAAPKTKEIDVADGKGFSVGSRIVIARGEANMTQLDLAKKVGVSRAAVGQWEINATSPSIAKLEEVAMVLKVAPQWLAYNVRPGAERIVYRNPERDNIVWASELDFKDSAEKPVEGDKWGFPAEYLTREIRTSLSDTAIVAVNSHAVEPAYEYGDRVFVDRSDKKPSPAGVFCYWDGLGMAFAQMQALPGGEKPSIRISQQGGDPLDVPFEDVQIIGRVKGRIQRG